MHCIYLCDNTMYSSFVTKNFNWWHSSPFARRLSTSITRFSPLTDSPRKISNAGQLSLIKLIRHLNAIRETSAWSYSANDRMLPINLSHIKTSVWLLSRTAILIQSQSSVMTVMDTITDWTALLKRTCKTPRIRLSRSTYILGQSPAGYMKFRLS